MNSGTIAHANAAIVSLVPTEPLIDYSKGRTPASCGGCPTIWYRKGDEHCCARMPDGSHCGKNFSSTAAGDRHVKGTPAKPICMTTEEMVAATKRNGKKLFEHEVIDGNVVWRIA